MNETNNLSQLFIALPLFLQNKIKQYLRYGTKDSFIIKNTVQNSKKMRDNHTLTLYDLFIYNHGYVKCHIFDNMPLPIAFQELELIRIASDATVMDDNLKQYLVQHLTHQIKRKFVSKYESLL